MCRVRRAAVEKVSSRAIERGDFEELSPSKVGLKSCHNISNDRILGAKNLIGDFKVKSQMANQQKRIDSFFGSISAITRRPLDVPSSEESRRLNQSERYRMR